MSEGIVQSKDPCPVCLLQNKVVNELQTRMGQHYTNCRAGHKFEDMEELNILRSQARGKYPNLYRGPAPAQPMDPALLASQDIVINAETKQAIESLVGQPLTGGSDLKGLMYAYIQSNKDMEAEIRTLRATIAMMNKRTSTSTGTQILRQGLLANQVIVTIPEWAIEGGIAQQAEHAGMGMDEWIGQEIASYFENYFSPSVQGK